MKTKWLASCIGLGLILVVCILHFFVLPRVDGQRNGITIPGPYTTTEEIRQLHNQSFVADLHADSLLWGRDHRELQNRGHVDIPRLQAGGVDLQVFSVVSKVPKSKNYDANSGETDSLPLLFMASLRPPSTWFDPKHRALVQAREMTELAENSPISIVLSREDLFSPGIKGLLALEGVHALGSEKDSLQEFYQAGFRMMGLVHHFDNRFAGSAHGINKHGLTDLGRILVPNMEAMGITIDLAHASQTTFDEVLDIATRPVVVSHGGVQKTCPGPRNLSDEQLRKIAKNGGVVGIGYWKDAICDMSLNGIREAILHVISIAGIDHVGLGSDFDGYVATLFDTTGLPMLTESLVEAGLTDVEVKKILGGNVRRVLAENLPE